MTTIDDYVADAADQRRFGVMKIDVEGAEIEVLKGAQHSIASFRPALIIEIQPNNLQGWMAFSKRASTKDLASLRRRGDLWSGFAIAEL